MLGGGLASSLRLSPHLRLAADLVGEGTTAIAPSGAITVLSVSSAPRVVVHAGGRIYAELGLGARLGVASMNGQAFAGNLLVGRRVVRPWLGPAAGLAIGVELARRISLHASVEVGAAITGAIARDLGAPAAALDGRWTSLGLAAAFAL